MLTILSSEALAQTSPVTVSTILGHPASVYLPDYYMAGSNKLTANLILNDFNEPSRDVYLKITIECQNVKIISKPDYVPASPITLYPGELVALSGADFEEYLNYNNIITEGISKEQLISRGGRLPEGLYNFCIEAFDMITKKSLSNNSCAISLIAQFEPPTPIMPEENGMVAPMTSQNIVFQWINNAGLNPTELNYKFVLYELIDPYADPKQAIGNNQALIIHEEEMTTPQFNYNTSHPLLEIGKTYIYRIQCFTNDGRAFFKNDGYSEPSYFHYGYPGNGKITLLEPEDNSALFLRLEKIFRWTPPDNLMSGQNYYSIIRIAKADSLRTDEEVLADENIHFTFQTQEKNGPMNTSLDVDAHFPTGDDFVWQVKAYTDDQEIASSDIQHFGGPPCILDFIAADIYINVTSTSGCQLVNISGTGNVQIDPNGNRHDVAFNNVTIGKEGVQYFLQKGEVLADVSDLEPFKLSPEYSRNGDAWFFPDSIKLTRHDYFMKGHIEWTMPHAVDQDEAPIIKSITKWIRYEDFFLLGPMELIDSTNFDLLDPMNFNIEFTEGSRFYIRGNNNFTATFNGIIHLPDNVTSLSDSAIAYVFSNHNQLFNIYSHASHSYGAIKVANRTTLSLKPMSFVLDLDTDDSPQLFKSNPLWKGLYITSGIYSFNGDFAYSKQFATNEIITASYDFDSHDSIHAYVINNGLWAKTKIDFGTNNQLYFNTFPASVDLFSIEVERSMQQKGYIDGSIMIPLLDDVNDFGFTAKLNEFGFMPGYLHNDIEGRTFEYNAGSEEQKLLLTFDRGYFADNERLETTVSIEWPYLDVSFSSIPMFRIWGDYDIGFGGKNEAFTLAQQKQTRLKGFEITIDGIGAGRQANAYAIGLTSKIVMAEDASGPDGPPVINFYSIFKSSKINEELVLSGSQYENVDQSENNTSSGGSSSVGQAIDNVATLGDAEALLERYKQEAAEAEAKANALIPRKTVGLPQPKDDLKEDLKAFIPTGDTSAVMDSPVDAMSYQDLIAILDFLIPFLEKERQDQVEGFKELLVSFSPEQLEEFIAKFSDIRGLINGIIKVQIDAQIAKVTEPLKTRVDNLNLKIETGIMNGTDSLLSVMGKGIDVPINGFVDLAITTVNNSPLEDKKPLLDNINKVATSLRVSLKSELERSVKTSVDKNIIKEATGIVDTVLYTGSVMYLSQSLSENASEMITNPDFTFADIDIDFDGMVQNNVDMLEEKITFEYFADRITITVDDAISGYNWDNVKDSILGDLLGGSMEAFIEGKVTEAVTNALGETAGGVVGGLAKNVNMDLDNIGQKLKDGDLSGIITFDPSHIVIITPVIDMEGYVKFTEDDPLWGDSFQAMLNATIKKPVILNAFAKFINGSKPVSDVTGMTDLEKSKIETYKFWFFEAGVHGFYIPIAPIPIALTGFEGKIYHHMERQSDFVTYYPNDSINFGIGAKVAMVDAGSSGKIATFGIGMELMLSDEGFEIGMNGDALIANPEATATKGEGAGGAQLPPPDKPAASTGDSGGATDALAGAATGGDVKAKLMDRALVIADGFMFYNSVDKHFLANLSVNLNTAPLLCAGGTMVIDISKDWWQFAIGTREDPIKVSVLCKTDIFRGWFDINKTGLDIGLMTNINFDLTSPWIGIGVIDFRGWTYFFFDFEAELVMFWQPDFGIQKGRVFIDIGAGVGIDYKTPVKSGSFTIAAVNLGGTLEFATIPEAYLMGEVHGSVTVLNISASVSMDAHIKF